ncbi:MAG: glycoside hydrolase family 3 C-terminal domain-containing protein, partial [Propionibacteriaceae bacterium]|nr:glycoside hydrolase family 3 C-terminal domain-containing protein [Propionibacteriaceae bacterium]
MTVAEKIAQLDDKPPAIARLGLASYDYWNEALHGVVASGTTMFPSPTAIGSTWNRGLVNTLGTIISDEARVLNNTTGKGLTYWSPTLNISRDPRWGRADESYGEDPYLVGQIGGEFIKGVQGSDPTYLKGVSTPKHYFANNSESNRRNGNSVVTEREIREYYTPAFAYALSPEVGAYSYMTAYNRVNGTPMSYSTEYLQDLPVRTWGFTGYVTSDCSAIQDGYNRHKWVPEGWDHNVTQYEGVAWGIKAGTDIDCQGNDYEQYLQGAYDRGYVTDADIDSELVKLLTARFKLGEFDPASQVPYRGSEYSTAEKMATAENQAASLAVSKEAPVLLKNNSVAGTSKAGLPLTAEDENIAVVGYLAQNFTSGGYSGSNPVDSRTFMQGISQVAAEVNPNATVTYVGAGVTPAGVVSGYAPFDLSSWFGMPPGSFVIAWASSVASGKPGVQGMQFKDASGSVVKTISAMQTQNGYPLSISDNPAPDQFIKWEGWMGINWGYSDYMQASSVWGGYITVRADLSSDVTKVCMNQTGGASALYPDESMTPGTEINVSTTPAGAYFDVHLDAMDGPIVASIPATGSDFACAADGSHDIALNSAAQGLHDLYFVYNYGTLGAQGTQGTDGHPYAIDLDTTAQAQISSADAVVVVIGTTNAEASEEMDRVNIDLPRFQDDIVNAVAALNPHTVVWLQSVGTMDIEKFRNNVNVPSIVWSNYNGQAQAVAAGDILFGKVNPSGKLPMTWYSDLDQLGSVWDYQITPTNGSNGRTYQYFTGQVSYPFGYGLSYSTFLYSNLRLDKSSYTGDDTITAKVDVTNSSTIPGKETVQLYVTAPGANGIDRPKRQLQGFEKISLAAYETKTVSIEVAVEDLWFWDDAADKAIWDKGTWKLQMGPRSGSGPLTTFALTADPTPYLKTVAMVPDGLVLNTASPDSVIHSGLSAVANDQSFLDLDSTSVDVVFTSADPSVAVVDADGVVSPVGVGVTSITATVTALGNTKSDTYAVVVEGDDADPVINLADKTVELGNSAAINAAGEIKLAPAGSTTSIEYMIAEMDENTAGATIDPVTGVVTATQVGKVRVTALGDVDGVKVVQAAIITVVPNGALTLDKAALTSAIADAQALAAQASAASAASSGLNAAITAAQAALASATTQKELNKAVEALTAAVAAASPSLVLVDSPAARAAAKEVLSAIAAQAESIKADGYSTASYATLVTAIATAKGVVADSSATVTQIQAAIDAVNAAVKGLTAPAQAAPKVAKTASVAVSGKAFKKK